jgi:hypothetical protein
LHQDIAPISSDGKQNDGGKQMSRGLIPQVIRMLRKEGDLDHHSRPMQKMLEHIDAQAKQIATLKAAIRKERLLAIDRNIGNLAFRKSMVNDQLARELPEIDWGDVE